MDGIYNRIIEKDVIKKLQDKFCLMAGIYAMCLDSEGEPLSELSGEKEDVERLMNVVSKEQMHSLCSRVGKSSLEEQAVEDTENEALKYAAVCIKAQGRPVITWLVCAVFSDAPTEEGRAFAAAFAYQTTLARFTTALDLLREISQQIVCHKLSTQDVQLQDGQGQYYKAGTEAAFRRMEAATEVMQLLDSEAPIEEVMKVILNDTGTFLRLDNAYLCTVCGENQDRIAVTAEWCAKGAVSSFDQAGCQPRPAYLYREKPLVISSGTCGEELEKDLKKSGLTALAVMPVKVEDKISLYACFEVRKRSHTWDLEEVKFLNDAVRVLQSILTRRMHQDVQRDSNAILEEILDHVGSAVYLRDKETGKILFANGRLRSAFPEELEQNVLADIFESSIPKEKDSGNLEIYREDRCCWYELFYKELTWADSRKVLLCSICDITEKKMYQQEQEKQQKQDKQEKQETQEKQDDTERGVEKPVPRTRSKKKQVK